MRVHLHPVDEAGCGYYRMQEPCRAARLYGVDAEIHETFKIVSDGTEQTKVLPTEADVIVMQRPVKHRYINRVEEFQAMGVAVVIEIDDDLSALHPQHVSREFMEGRREGDADVHWRVTAKLASIADMVTVTSEALAERFAPHGRAAVIPNCVPAALLEEPRLSNGHTVGWTGAINYHPGDLEITYGGVQGALEGTDWEFLKIGGGPERCQRGLDLKHRPESTGPLPIEGYHRALGGLDIGIVPLADSRFNQAKSYLKGIEYAARGVPFVASPVAEYERLHEMGLGLLAKDRARSWKTAIRLLMQNGEQRAEMAERGKEIVREHCTFEAQGWQWAEAWEEAVRVRQAHKAAA